MLVVDGYFWAYFPFSSIGALAYSGACTHEVLTFSGHRYSGVGGVMRYISMGLCTGQKYEM